ncbi:MAG TPA: hypothetical protein VGB64_12960 [Actinomycetota bacterium]
MIEAKIRDLLADIASAPVVAQPSPAVLRRARRRRIRNGSGIILLSVAIVCGAGLGAGVVRRALGDGAAAPVSGGGGAPTMTSVTPGQIAEACCRYGLRAPSTNDPPLSKERAEQIALGRTSTIVGGSFPPGTIVLESVLASTPENPPAWSSAGVPVDDFWIVSMWPPNGEFGRCGVICNPSDPPFSFGLIFVDARTGTWLSTARG